ncbi:MAG: rod-binding protein [Planctomycetes bacterium]|nr:rod-binding protein [Planctomycetota bacterium]
MDTTGISLAARMNAPAAPSLDPVRRTAEQFEAFFLRDIVGKMRDSARMGVGEGMFGDDAGSSTYSDFFDQSLAEHMVRGGGLGLAPVLEKLIRKNGGAEAANLQRKGGIDALV